MYDFDCSKSSFKNKQSFKPGRFNFLHQTANFLHDNRDNVQKRDKMSIMYGGWQFAGYWKNMGYSV